MTLVFRVLGGIGAGTAADRWGRKPPIIFSIAWFTAFAFLSGLSTSYVMLFAFRALFGIGMGGMWAAGVPLALEHLPNQLRGVASGLLQGGFSFGFMLSSLVYQFGWPLVDDNPDWGWRFMLWAGVLPALVILGVMATVKESPVWLEQQRQQRASGVSRERLSVARLFDRDLRWVTMHTSVLMATFIFSYHSITFWYPTLLRGLSLAPLSYLIALNAGGLIGSVVSRPAVGDAARPAWGTDARDDRRSAGGAALSLVIQSQSAAARCASHRSGLLGRLGHRPRLSLRAVSRRKRARSGPALRITSAPGSGRLRRS